MVSPDSSSELPQAPDFAFEIAARGRGFKLVAGVDEAGRGPLAGPVVAAAVMFETGDCPDGLNDSKKLTEGRREELFIEIMAMAAVSVAVAPPSLIDTLNIRGATLWAMRQAVQSLSCAADHVLVDGRDIPPGLTCSAEAVIGGDGRCLSIAAASIVAKVTRDRMCPVMDADHPGFGFAQHKGYGTPMHLSALTSIGACAHHRRSFAPVAAAIRELVKA